MTEPCTEELLATVRGIAQDHQDVMSLTAQLAEWCEKAESEIERLKERERNFHANSAQAMTEQEKYWKAEVERLRKALEFYATDDGGGDRARAALVKEE
jgi:hypothetical protein